MSSKRRVCSLAVALLVSALCACEEDQPLSAADGGTGDAAASDNDADGSLYVIATSYITGDDIETYLVTSKTFDESTKIDAKAGPKLLGGIDIIIHDQAVFAPDSNGPVMLRYELDSRDKLEQKAELSFAGRGVTEIFGQQVYILNDTKAYLFDRKTPRLIVWNPESMTLTGEEIDLSDIVREGFNPIPGLGLVNLGAVKRDKQLLIPLRWEDQDGNTRYASGLIVIDTETDAVVAIDDDERCGGVHSSVAAPNGDIYFFPPAWTATQQYYVDEHQPTCILRVRPDETEFDPDFELDLSKLGSGTAAAGAIPDGKNGFFFMSVEQELWDERDDDLAAFWRIWHYDFETQESRRIDDLPVWIGHAHYTNMKGEIAFVYWEETETGNRTTFYGVDGANDPKRLFSYDASWYSFGKLR